MTEEQGEQLLALMSSVHDMLGGVWYVELALLFLVGALLAVLLTKRR